jgi:DHA2 family multidrug resistance protein
MTTTTTMNSELSPLQKVLLFLALSIATFMFVLDYSIANVAIPYIAGDLSVSTDEGVYVITSFAVGNAIGLAMTGWLTKRVGDVKLLCLSIFLFTFFSWICGVSFDLQMLVISRFVQGLVAGPMVPLSQSMIVANAAPQNRTRDLALWSTVVITAPVLGPVLGGYISEWYSWPWIFYINIPIGLTSTLIIWILAHKKQSPIQKSPFDLFGCLLLAAGVTCLQILLDKGQQWDWLNSNTIRVLLITSIISFTLLIIYELLHENPFLELRLFRIPSYTLSIISLMVSYGVYFGSVVIVPLWLQEYMDYDATWAGIAVCSLGIAPALFSFLTPKIITKIGTLPTLMICFAIFGSACFFTTFYFTPQVDIQVISFSRFFFGFALILYVPALFAMSVAGIKTEKLPAAMGIFHFIRSMIGGVGTSVFVTLFQRRTIFHHERIGSTLTEYNPLLPDMQLPLLNRALDVQAAMLALNDAFYLMGWLFMGLVALLAIWRFWRGKPPSHAPVVQQSSD